MKRIHIDVARAAASARLRGYLIALAAASKREGEFFVLTNEAWAQIRQKFSPPQGLGDRLHDALAPAVHLIDRTLGTDLAHCDGCEKRRQWLNQLS